MDYVDRALVADERVVARAALSWWPLLGPAVISALLMTVPLLIAGNSMETATGAVKGIACAAVLIPLFLLPVIAVVVELRTTELAVTNRRIIGKRGWLGRTTLEILLPQVESLGVKQGVAGTALGYGILEVRGTGGTVSRFPHIKNPEEFRKQFAAQADCARQSTLPGGLQSPAVTANKSVVTHPLFEVQVLDRNSGAERWIDVRADTLEQARDKVVATGRAVGISRLKSLA